MPCSLDDLFPPLQVIESLALEDTDIKPEHIEQIKELIKKEVILEDESSDSDTD